jgi:membrane fusion protein (multidrug efflux system)
VVYHGTVAGFGAGTGSAFSLLPAQNATGNWIKIVQRVAVRVALDPHELAMHPLQIGLSMKAEVDVRNGDGERLPQLVSLAPGLATEVFAAGNEHADERVRAIIVANGADAHPAIAAAQASSPHDLYASTPLPAGPGAAHRLH